MKRRVYFRTGFFFFLTLLLASVVFAGDGQIDILPNGSSTFTISESGSYVLTGNVTMTADVNCIDVTAGNVTLDLGGHSLSGMGENSYGIFANNAYYFVLKNGCVRGFGKDGVFAAGHAHMEDVNVIGCKRYGIQISHDTRLYNVMSTGNGNSGIYGYASRCIVENCKADSNGNSGISVAGISLGECSVIRGCVVSGNSSGNTSANINIYGIEVGSGSLIVNNICEQNSNKTTWDGGACYGIYTGSGSVVKNNVCRGNSADNTGTDVYGIKTGSNCIIQGNTVENNRAIGNSGRSIGVFAGHSSQIKDNVCAVNSTTKDDSEAVGIEAAGFCRIMNNNCRGNEGIASSTGIFLNGDACRVENNYSVGHVDGDSAAGIALKAPSSSSAVIRNNSHGNKVGIDLGNGEHYCAENMVTDKIVNTTNVTMGTGDRSNVTY